RLVCSNGMVCNDFGERKAHVGRQAKALEDSFAVYSDATLEAEDRAFMLLSDYSDKSICPQTFVIRIFSPFMA
ncbi:MAG: hypothetical protein IJH64_05940, partial [Oscillospiraceae bacterium]|nr:hypothetical protein [Oscillospiraceae bacterium]